MMSMARPFPRWHYRAYLPSRHLLILDWLVPYVLLSALAIFMVGVLLDASLWSLWWQWLPLMVVTVVLFFIGLWHAERLSMVWVLLFTLLANLAMLYTPAGLALLLLSSVFQLRQTDDWHHYLIRVLLLALTLWHGYWLDVSLLVLVIVAVIALFNIKGDDFFLRYLEQQIASLARKTQDEELARLAERERIARDLHDVLSQQLVAIHLKSQLVLRASDLPASAVVELQQINQLARNSLQDMRKLITGYYQGQWRYELQASQQLLASQGIVWHASIEAEAVSAHQPLLAMVLREGVTNVLKHAQATQVCLRLVSADGFLQLSLDNDGVADTATGLPGHGLDNLRHRLQPFAAQLQAGQRADHFTLQVWLPAPLDVGGSCALDVG